MEEKIYSLKGCDGHRLDVYEDKVVRTIKPGFGSFMNGNAWAGAKTIYFVDCVGIQFKKHFGIMPGFLQFETAGGNVSNNENTFYWSFTEKQTIKVMEEVAEYCKKRIDETKSSKNSSSTTIIQKSNADELVKFKQLLDSGIITQEEFDAKKKQLLEL